MSNPMEEPFAGESDLYHFVTQETRYLIVQYVLAHPENLPSLEELDHAIPKGKSTIHEHIGRLRDRGIIDAYEIAPERRSRDLPSTFYGLTEYGIYVVEELGLLDAKGMLQATYANMDKPEQIRRYEDAPRPERKSDEELREELDDLVVGDDEGEPAAAQKVMGIANLLAGGPPDEAGVGGSASVRLDLDSKAPGRRTDSSAFSSRWLRDRTKREGVDLLDPEVYSSRELERDLRSIDAALVSTTTDIEELEAEANEAGRNAARVSSEALERMHKQDATHALKQIDQKEAEVNRLLRIRGLILAIQHARQTLHDDDLSLDEMRDGENADELAGEIRSMLVDLGLSNDDVKRITDTLDLPGGEAEGEYSDAVDQQIEQLRSREIGEDEFDLSAVRE